MRIIKTHETKPEDLKNQWERDQVYNGLDCCVTLEVLNELLPQLDNHTTPTYAFSRDLQGPILEMRLRGLKVDNARKNEVIEDYFDKLDFLEGNLEKIVLEGCGLRKFNWRSNADLHTLFYEALGIPPIKRGGRPTVDRNALEKIASYEVARPIVAHLLTMRDLGKKIGVLRTDIDSDLRMRTSYNIAGTTTGRLSSSFSEFGTGGNLQNVEESLRSIFISDDGMKFAKFDAKSGESYVVGAIEWNLFGDDKYLNACEEGDVHTAAARACWPELAWTGDNKVDKDLAEQPFYRHYSRRFMCKKLGHGSNYGGKPVTLASQTKLPLGVVTDFQPRYFEVFPAHIIWQSWVDEQIRRYGYLVSLTGRKRHFWGRRNDADTLREAIAYDPQCSLADIVNSAMLRIWREGRVQMMMQDHDALTVQYPAKIEDEIIPYLLDALKQPIELAKGRTLLIPYDCKVGWNRGEYNEKSNPQGLKDYYGTDQRKRAKKVGILDRKLR